MNAETISFLLQDSGPEHVTANNVLHALSKTMAETNAFLPKGMDNADLWMARHGNPLASTESAFAVAGAAGKLLEMGIRVDTAKGTADVSLTYSTGERERLAMTSRAVADSLPVAICAATMDYLSKKGVKS